jgi:hypothetical protein
MRVGRSTIRAKVLPTFARITTCFAVTSDSVYLNTYPMTVTPDAILRLGQLNHLDDPNVATSCAVRKNLC